MVTRRQFNKAMVLAALTGLSYRVSGASSMTATSEGFGMLQPDPNGILDLPAGFSYKVISRLHDPMDDGLVVPDRADGMGCFALDEQRVVLVRNHELKPQHNQEWPVTFTDEQIASSYDTDGTGRPLAGGTSTMVYNLTTQRIEQQYMSLLGTIRNCAGGITPWGSWLSCEESVDKATDGRKHEHGYVFEVPANAKGLAAPTPIKAMGRFNHEAAVVDPATGIVYLTEDRGDSLFYRFIPKQPGNLHAGGQLQALVIKGQPQFDTRNWTNASMPLNQSFECEWIDLDNVTSPEDDLRKRGYAIGAALFARGEGIIFGDNELYFCCTNGGAKKLGQIMRYRPSADNPTLSLFLESDHPASFNYGDNVCIAPNGDLIVCEDQYTDVTDNHLKGVTPAGNTYDLAKVCIQTEPAGVCFSPDGSTMFVNLYSPTMTLAITGPWV